MPKCVRCHKDFNFRHPLDAVCPKCLEENPKLSVSEKQIMNLWDKFEDFLEVYNLMKSDKWSWASNVDCKYINLRIDMRDGGCIIANREGKRISPEQLAWQYSSMRCTKCGSEEIAACEHDDSSDIEYICTKCDTVLEKE